MTTEPWNVSVTKVTDYSVNSMVVVPSTFTWKLYCITETLKRKEKKTNKWTSSIKEKTLSHNILVPMTMTSASPKMSGLPYLIWAMSPTTMSDTGSWMTWLPRTTWNFCSCSMRLCSPRNCFSFDQSLKAVTNTTHTTDNRMAAPSIQPASASPSSSTPPAAMPHAVFARTKHTDLSLIYKGLYWIQAMTAWCGVWLCLFLFHLVDLCHVSFDATPRCLSVTQWRINFSFGCHWAALCSAAVGGPPSMSSSISVPWAHFSPISPSLQFPPPSVSGHHKGFNLAAQGCCLLMT